jgi:poly-beta-1,6-N-acetyl-D-glucosamine synthase
MLSYVLITAARNEEINIASTIHSVMSQTLLPKKWVIVSDGSTDRTDQLVMGYLPGNSWIEFIRMPEHRDRHFAAKVQCFHAGYEKVKHLEFDIIGNLDADISFGRDYFEYLMHEFVQDPLLGVAGTPFTENGRHYDYRYTNIEHVSGACQLFRRKCFEEIGGYVPIKKGGIDWVAVTTARMKGWKTRTFTERVCLHARKIGTGNARPLLTWLLQGQKDYFLGNHPLWEVFRSVYQMTKPPFIIGGGLLLLGYVWALLRRQEVPISKEIKEFVRKEQMHRLKKLMPTHK